MTLISVATNTSRISGASFARLELRIAKTEGELMPVAEFDQAIEQMAGLTLTALSGWPARIAGTDVVLRPGGPRPWCLNCARHSPTSATA
jgi:hypothetical protein